MKRLIIMLMILLSLPITGVTAKNYSASKTGIGKMLEDTKLWKTTDEQNITVTKDGIKNGIRGFAWKEDYKNSNEIIEFDMNTKYNGSWLGIMLRATKPDVYPWSGNSCILFVIKEEQIELQIYADEKGGGGYMLQIAENPIKNGVTSRVAVGAITTDEGVQIIFAVDGEPVINNIMPEIKNDEGYFTIMNFETITDITPAKTDMNYLIPCNVSVDGEYIAGNELNVEFDTISTTDNRECEVKWYTKAGEASECVAEGTSYVLKNEDSDKYVYAGILEKGKEKEVFSEEIFFDSAKDYMKKDIVMLKDWFISYANGEQKQIDEDFSVAPFLTDEKIYIPLRFVSQALGYEVSWNEADRSVSMSKGDNLFLVEAEKMKLINNRSFISEEMFENSFGVLLYFDADTGVVVADSEKNFDETKENIYRRLYNYLINGV